MTFKVSVSTVYHCSLERAFKAPMVGSYITIFSAFLVVNNHGYFPEFVVWFGPTVVLVPLIILWQKKYAHSQKN